MPSVSDRSLSPDAVLDATPDAAPGAAPHGALVPTPELLRSLTPEDARDLVVLDEDDDDPVLLRRDGTQIDTWREGYPYDERMSREEYEAGKRLLQIELLKLQAHIKDTDQKVAILFEGRDAAGKGGAIKRFTEHLNPRGARVVALSIPSDREKTQWYFQRYVPHLPSGGEIVLFDRSWYNRAGVERVMGFCTQKQYEDFAATTPMVEKALIDDGIVLVKYWLSLSDVEQRRRFQARIDDPAKRWKLSAMDLEAQSRWVDYAEAKDAMFRFSDTPASPWWVVDADDKKSKEYWGGLGWGRRWGGYGWGRPWGGYGRGWGYGHGGYGRGWGW